MNDVISTIPELEACVGAAGLPIKMKIIDHLDAEAARWIAAAPLGFVAAGGPDGPRVAVAGGPPGFAQVTDETTLRVPLNAVDPLGEIEAGQGAGVLFLIPGIGETLRANGRVRRVADGALEIAVEECFIHCAKALIRSDFWTPAAVLVAHLKLNKARGAQATMLRLAVNRGLIAKGLEANYRTDLY